MEHGRELEQRGCQVVLVGIGKLSNAREWKEANRVRFPYPLVLDPETKLYRELGQKRSVAGVWMMSALVDFAEQEVAGTLVLEHFEGDDVNLLAGDFISDPSGTLILAHVGTAYNDRPSIEAILAALDAAS